MVRLVTNLRSYGNGFCPSLRASLMIAAIAKKSKIEMIAENIRYQVLCMDVLIRPMTQILPKQPPVKIKELILKEILRREGKK